MKGNILFTFNIFFLKWREKVEQQKHTYEIKQNIWRLWFYIYYIYIFFIHQFIIFIKTYSSIQNLSKYCFCLWMHCFWSMWTQHYKLCVHVESVSHRRKDNHNILNKFCFISNNTKKKHMIAFGRVAIYHDLPSSSYESVITEISVASYRILSRPKTIVNTSCLCTCPLCTVCSGNELSWQLWYENMVLMQSVECNPAMYA